MTTAEREVYARFEALGIVFTRHEHPAVVTVEQAEAHWAGIDATHCKNLFLRNQPGTRHYLLTQQHLKRANLRAVADQLGDGRLSFASPERLMTCLGVTPGALSPFGLIHERARGVQMVLDRELALAERLSFHPNVNTVTITVSAADFARFLASTGHSVRHVTV